jgi:hypothetical protein
MLRPGASGGGRWLQFVAVAAGAAGTVLLTYLGLERLLGDCDCGAASQSLGGAAMLLGAAVLLPLTLGLLARWVRDARAR